MPPLRNQGLQVQTLKAGNIETRKFETRRREKGRWKDRWRLRHGCGELPGTEAGTRKAHKQKRGRAKMQKEEKTPFTPQDHLFTPRIRPPRRSENPRLSPQRSTPTSGPRVQREKRTWSATCALLDANENFKSSNFWYLAQFKVRTSSFCGTYGTPPAGCGAIPVPEQEILLTSVPSVA